MLEKSTRLRYACVFDKNEQQATERALSELNRRCPMQAPPPLASDGHNGCGEAMLEVWGRVPAHSGKGRKPVHKRAAEDWQHLKVIKNRGDKKTSVYCERTVVFGDVQQVTENLGTGTVYLERSHLTMRNFNARIARKGLGRSQKLEMHVLAAAWEDLYYNSCHVVRTLREDLYDPETRKAIPRFAQKFKHFTPMMKAKITDHVWTVKELLHAIPLRA